VLIEYLEDSLRQCYCNDVQESSFSNNDNVHGDLMIDDQMEDSPVDTANACSTLLVPQPCTCAGCTDYTKPNQPQEVSSSVKGDPIARKGSQVY